MYGYPGYNSFYGGDGFIWAVLIVLLVLFLLFGNYGNRGCNHNN